MDSEPNVDDGPGVTRWYRSPKPTGRAVLEALVREPRRCAGWAFAGVAFLWLFAFMAGTALGVRTDPVPPNDWLTLVFTTYALSSSLGLAHRLYQVGVTELTREYFVDVVALTWLTAFYFVWTLARTRTPGSTTLLEQFGPVLAGDPAAVFWATVASFAAVVTVGIVRRPTTETTLFESPLRVGLVTLPSLLTAAMVVANPGPNSLLWALVTGVFLGTVVGGLAYVQSIAAWIAGGVGTAITLVTWSAGAAIWQAVYRTSPPATHPVLERVEFGSGQADTGDGGESSRTIASPTRDETDE